jgi:hypothetical protein
MKYTRDYSFCWMIFHDQFQLQIEDDHPEGARAARKKRRRCTFTVHRGADDAANEDRALSWSWNKGSDPWL